MKNIITDIYLSNFQSHKNTHISLDRGLNAIVGPSGVGKSAIIRGLEFVLFNKIEDQNFITLGEEKASVRVVFSNGKEITRERIKKENIYTLSHAGSEDVVLSGFGTGYVKEVVDFHGIKPIRISGEDVFVSVQSQHSPPFFLSDNPTKKANVIGSIAKTDIIDLAIIDVSKDITKSKGDLKQLENELSENLSSLSKYEFLPILKEDISICERKESELSEINSKIKEASSFKERISKGIATIKECSDIKSKEDEISLCSRLVESCYSKKETITALSDILERFEKNTKKYKEAESISKKISKSDIEKASLEISVCEDRNKKIFSLSEISNEISKSKEKLLSCEQSLKREESIKEASLLIEKTTPTSNKIKEIENVKGSFEVSFNRYKKGIGVISAKENTIETLNVSLEEFIKENPICDVCGSDLSKGV